MPAIAQTVIVDSNTSVVLLNTQTITDNQDIVVLLSTSTLPGRIVSIRDTTGNMTPLRRIVISTMSGAQYYNTNFPSSVVINQPLGFVTVTNRDPYTWVLQNTFAFPAELSVADVQGVNANYVFANTLFSSNAITTKTHLYAASTVSTTYVNTMDVLASGNLYVGSTSALSNAPRFQTTGNAVFTGNVSAWSTISTGQDIVVGRSLNVISSFNVGGSTVMFGNLSTVGAVAFASTLTVNSQTTLSNLSTLGPTIGFGADVFMTANTLNTSTVRTRELVTSNTTTTLNLVVNCNTSLSNLSVSGPTINVGADLYITNNSIFAASTLAKSITASNILMALSTNTSSLTVYTLANLSSISTTGIAAFVNDVYLASNMFVASNIQVSSLSTFFMAATSTTTSTLTVTGRATITNMSTFGAIGFGDDVYINPNHTLHTQNAVTSSVSVTDLLAAGFISTNTMGVTTSIIIRGAPVILSPTTWDSPMTFINISTVSTSAVVASSVRATVAVASTFVGDGSYLTNLAAVSSLSLQSTIVGLGVFGYVRNTDVTSAVTAIQLNSSITGLGSAGYISSLGGSGFALSNAVATQVNSLFLNASSIALSNSLVATYDSLIVPSPAVFLNSPAPNRNVSIDMRTGANSQLLMGVLGDAFYSASIQSIDPATGFSQPLNIYGSTIFMVAANVQVGAGIAAAPYTEFTPSNVTTGTVNANIVSASNLNMNGVVVIGSNLRMTGGASSYLSNSGMLSNVGAAAYFLSTSNNTTLGVAGATILASNLTMTAAAGFLSNAGIFSNASNVFLTGAFLSNAGSFSNVAAGAFFQNTSNTGTLGVGGATILASNLTMTTAAGFLSNAGVFSNASNVLFAGSFLSNAGSLSNVGAGAFFQNTSNTGTLGVALPATLASNVLLTGGTNAFLSNSGVLSNTGAAAYFQNTSNVGSLGVGFPTTLASNVLLTGGTGAFLSNSGVLSNTAAAAYFQNTSNAGTLGVAQATTLASNLTLTSAGGLLSNAGIFSNASNVLFAGAFLSNAGTLSNTAGAAFFQNTSNTGTLGVGQVATFASNIVTTGGASSYLSNAGVLSNVQAPAYFQTTSNTGSLNVAGTVMFASNITITGGTANYLSNSGILSNTAAAAYFQNTSNTGALGVAQITTLASNTLLTGGINSYLSNSGMFSNVAAGAFFQNTSNAGTLGVAQTGTFSTVIITGSLYGTGVPSIGTWYTFPAVSNVTFQSNITMTGGTSSYLSNSGMLCNVAAGAFFQNTSNAGTLGVALPATLASNLTLTASGSLFSNAGNASNLGNFVNGGFFANVVGSAYFAGTSNTGVLGVAGITTHTSNILQTAGAAYLSNAGIFSNASNVILSGGTGSYLSNTGVLSNTLAGAFFQNTSNTATLGVALTATFASNLTMTASGSLLSNAGNLSNAGYLVNGGALSNTAAGAFFQNTSNTGTLGVAGPATLASNLTLATAGAYFSNAGPLSNAGITSIASNVLLTGGASSYLSNSGVFSNAGLATFASNVYTRGPGAGSVSLIMGPNTTPTNLDFCSMIQSCNNNGVNYGSELSFWTHGTGSTGALPTRAVTIATNQYVGINCNSPSYLLDVNGAAQINGNLNITGTLSGGGFSAASWAQFPAVANVALGFSTITNGFVSNVATTVATAANFTTSRPVFFARTDTGIGQADPASFNLWHGVYVKHTGSANDQTLSLYATGAASGWTITCRDDFYAIGVPLNITASVLTLTANTSNTGTLGVAGLATFVNSSNTGTLGVAGITTHGANVNMNQNTVYNTFLSNSSGSLTTAKPILAARADTGSGAADPANFTLWKGTWVKHSLGGANDQFFSLDCTSASGGWVITSVWEGLQLMNLQFNADVVTFNATGTSNSGYMRVAGITTLANNVLLTGGTSSYLSNSGILSNTGAAAYFDAATISASQPFKLDVNGTSRGAIYYSTMTTGGTLTITTNNNYGVYYNITATGTYTIQVEATQQTSNIGKYYVFRNNSGGDLSVALTNATGITSPITIGSNTSATIVVTGVTNYALF